MVLFDQTFVTLASRLMHLIMFLGKVSVSVSWMSLYSSPVIVEIEDVFILAAPLGDMKFDEEREKDRLLAFKKNLIEKIENELIGEYRFLPLVHFVASSIFDVAETQYATRLLFPLFMESVDLFCKAIFNEENYFVLLF